MYSFFEGWFVRYPGPVKSYNKEALNVSDGINLKKLNKQKKKDRMKEKDESESKRIRKTQMIRLAFVFDFSVSSWL